MDNSINKLYARAKLPDLTVCVGFSDPANKIGISSLLCEIRRCRRCELVMDNWFRYWYLVRWHQLDKLDSSENPDILLGANVKNYIDYVAEYNKTAETKIELQVPLTGNYVNGSKGKVRAFDRKYYLYPIPSGQMTLNQNLHQNPWW